MDLLDPRPETVAENLAAAGYAPPDPALVLEPRDGRVLVRLGSDRMAWFPTDEAGRAGLARERRVLRLIAAHCRFPVPRVLHVDARGWDVRSMVPGESRPFTLRERFIADLALAHRAGAAIGRMLADQHTNVPAAALEGWLPLTPGWPRPEDLPRLPEVTGDVALLARIEAALALYAEAEANVADRVLVHADVGLHNIAFDPATDEVAGIFDYEGAAFADRCHDFKYLIIGLPGEALFEAAVAAYEPLAGVAIDRDRARVLHAAAAIAFLAFRAGHAPVEPWCGRTLAEDLAWTGDALTALGI
jgi:aminoglycoside phosphotransferase (APT) family kinase protein